MENIGLRGLTRGRCQGKKRRLRRKKNRVGLREREDA
jgi:hypothetical protein